MIPIGFVAISIIIVVVGIALRLLKHYSSPVNLFRVVVRSVSKNLHYGNGIRISLHVLTLGLIVVRLHLPIHISMPWVMGLFTSFIWNMYTKKNWEFSKFHGEILKIILNL